MSEPSEPAERPPIRLWEPPAEGKLMGRGHPVGDFLEAYEWDLLEEQDGLLRVRAHLPKQVMNPRGQLFGGFTAAYVDFLALHTFWAGREGTPGNPWLATINMRVDYFAPVVGEGFEMEGRVVRRGESTCFVEARFFSLLQSRDRYAESRDRYAESRDRYAEPRDRRREPKDPKGSAEPSREMLVYAYTTLKAVG